MDIKELRRKVGGMLDTIGLKYTVDKDGDYWVPFQDAIVFVCPGMAGETTPVVKIWSYVATELDMGTGLLDYVNTENCKMLFGKLCYYSEQRNMKFESPILATCLDADELKFGVGIAAGMTDRYNDEVISRWGGKKFVV